MRKRKYIKQLENMLIKLDKEIKYQKKENEDLKEQITKLKKVEYLDKELLEIAKKKGFKPLEVERYKPFKYYGSHRELIDKGIDENRVPQLEMVQVEDYDEEKRWTETITFEENPREYLDLIRIKYLRSIDV